MSASSRMVAGVMGGWSLGMALLFWKYDFRYLRPVIAPAGSVHLLPDQLPAAPMQALHALSGELTLKKRGEPITFLYFWNPDCPCSRETELDVRALSARYSQVRMIAVLEYASGNEKRAVKLWLNEKLATLPVVPDPEGIIGRKFGVSATPGAVILNHSGRVAYVGGFNASRFCHDTHTAWADEALTAIAAGKRPPHPSTLFYGCSLPGS